MNFSAWCSARLKSPRLPEALHPPQPEAALFQKQTSFFQNQKYLQGGGAILGLSACFIETKEYLCNHILLDNPPVGGKSLNYKGVSAHTETPFFIRKKAAGVLLHFPTILLQTINLAI